jgi:hypothetical protein
MYRQKWRLASWRLEAGGWRREPPIGPKDDKMGSTMIDVDWSMD